MSLRLSSLLALLSATGLGLLAYELMPATPSPLALTGLVLVALSSIGFVLTLRRMQVNAFRAAMSTYADKQMQLHRESRTAAPSFDAPSTVL